MRILMNGSNPRNANLDLIKCIACLCVTGLHAVGMSNYTIYYLCDCGVPLFFMVHGFLLLSREKAEYPYVFHKILRLLKIAFLWNLLISLPVFLFRHKIVNPFRLTLESLLQKGYLWHFWFFGALILIYLALPLLHKLVYSRKTFHKAACFALMCLCLIMSITSITKGYPLPMLVPQAFRLWTWLFYFLLGGLFAGFSEETLRISLPAHGVLLMVFTIINNLTEKRVGFYLVHNRLAEYFYDDFSCIVWCALLFTFLLRIPLSEKASAAIQKLSSLTLGIFIIHPILLYGLDAARLSNSSAAMVVFWLGLFLVSCLITWVISRLPLLKTLVKN